MRFIVVTDLIDKPVVLNVDMIERIHITSEAPRGAGCTIDMQSGKSLHAKESNENVLCMIKELEA